jgi:hypothetical protein
MYIAKHNYPTHEKNLDAMINFFFHFSNVFSPTSIPKKDITLIGNMFVNIIHYFKHHFILWLFGFFCFFFFEFYESFECFVFFGGEK